MRTTVAPPPLSSSSFDPGGGREGGGGPAILKLRTWRRFRPKLSGYCQAFISPTRKLLLLLSYEREALLITLDKGRLCQRILQQGAADFRHPRRTYSTLPEKSAVSLVEHETSKKSLDDNRSMIEELGLISDVSSLAWLHCGDTFSQHHGSAFRELLVVSSGHDVIVHAFCHLDTVSQENDSQQKFEDFSGKWVEWGPHYDKKEQYMFNFSLNSGESVNSNNTPIPGRSHGLHNATEFSEYGDIYKSSSYFRSFLVEMDLSEAKENFVLRFPNKSSPLPAQVVSFSIFGSVLNFLGSHTHTIPNIYQINRAWGDAFFSLGNKPMYKDTKTSAASESNSAEVPEERISGWVHAYRCSRVFSSSSKHYIGLVLTSDGDKNTSALETIVTILTVTCLGIQWLRLVDLQEFCPDHSPVIEWVDFQFVEDFLTCLTISGIVCIYDVRTGHIVSCVDVLHTCDVHLQANSKLDNKICLGREESSLTVERSAAELQERNISERKGTCSKDKSSIKRIFRRFVTSYSQVLAAVDEHGVVYLICTDISWLEKKDYCKSLPPFCTSGFTSLDGWKIAALGIGHRKASFESLGIQNLNILSCSDIGLSNVQSIKEVEYRETEKQYIQFKRDQMDSYPDCLYSCPPAIRKQNFHCKMQAPWTRRVFLPTEKFNGEYAVCFSPFGITRLVRSKNRTKIVNTCIYASAFAYDERELMNGLKSKQFPFFSEESVLVTDAIGFCFEGFLYFVTEVGISVVLPSFSMVIPHKSPNITGILQTELMLSLKAYGYGGIIRPWQVEVLDKTLVYEGPCEADYVCRENGWDLKVARMRRLELALCYLKEDEIEGSLQMMADADMAEEGTLKLLLSYAFKVFGKAGTENEEAATSRLLSLAARFARKMVRRYGLLESKKEILHMHGFGFIGLDSPKQQTIAEVCNSRRLKEMAYYLEIIRNLQQKMILKCRKPSHIMVECGDGLEVPEASLVNNESIVDSFSTAMVETSKTENLQEKTDQSLDNISISIHPSALSVDHSVDITENDSRVALARTRGKKLIVRENSRDMISRWEVDNFNLKTIVEDALHLDRLPLAVLLLHLHRLREMVSEEEPQDSFGEVRDVGRTIAYDLFLKGESRIAVETLQKLGEDIETSLRQLLFGTLRSTIRLQVAEEMKRYGCLTSHERITLARLSLIEMLYPSNSFWRTYLERQRDHNEVTSTYITQENKLQMNLHMWINYYIKCDEIDGVATGSWINVSRPSDFGIIDAETARAGYWVCAPIWSDSWNQTTIDRIVLDQPLTLGVHVLWESQFMYHMVHNNSDEILKLLDMIPSSALSDGILRINLCMHPDAYAAESNNTHYPMYISCGEDMEPVYLDIPNVKIFKFSISNMCSSWLKMLVEQELAKKAIFLKDYWESTAEIVPLLSRAGLINGMFSGSNVDELAIKTSDFLILNGTIKFSRDTAEAFHRVIICHCAHYRLPNLMDLYLDHHKLVLDNNTLYSLKEATGHCQWAKWLLHSRAKGHEYDASFANARSILSERVVLDDSCNILEADDVVLTVDDIAEGCGELAALATLIYAPVPIQKCLCHGSVSRQSCSTFQCTLENLRPGLQQFPTLWRALVASCFHHDMDANSMITYYPNVPGKSTLSDYLNWRNNVFSSSGGDTSLVQMVPCWFPKSIRRLVKLFVEGPLGWQMLPNSLPVEEAFLSSQDASVVRKSRNTLFSGVSWEVAIQRSMEELYSSFEGNKLGIEHHLHRGRALAAFDHLLALRAQKCKSAHSNWEVSGGSMPLPSNIQSSVQTLLEPLTPDERPIISSIMPLAIVNFEDPSLVSTCAFVLELLGLSTNMLHVDITALQHISSYFKSIGSKLHHAHAGPTNTAFHAVPSEESIPASLARALGDDYLQLADFNNLQQKNLPSRNGRLFPRSLYTVLQYLEKASTPSLDEGKTCGTWLKCGYGNGNEFRSRQKADSQRWSLVTAFCQMHHLPSSTRYLALLAKDNDWVGFLTEGQHGGFPIETVISVADKEFSDPRLRSHILTVLKSMQSLKKKAGSPASSASMRKISETFTVSSSMTPVELFALVTECEGQKNPGEALLVKAKELRWSLLATIAACFSDVSPLVCLTVWLEISAAREASLMKVNVVSSQITKNTRAAVEATNGLPPDSREVIFHYSRMNAKRRRLVDFTSSDHLAVSPSNFTNSAVHMKNSSSHTTTDRLERFIIANEEAKDFTELEAVVSLSNMIAILCEQHLFLLVLKAFEMFLPSCSLLPFIRFLQAFSQMRLSEASAHLASFSARLKEGTSIFNMGASRDGQISTSWISSTSVKAADAVLSTCPSAYEKRCLLQLLATADFGDGGTASASFKRHYWKINLAEPSLRDDNDMSLGNEILDDVTLLMALGRSGHWDEARSWAEQLESSADRWKSSVHHVTEMQAEDMVAEWKEFLWDVPDERTALWNHCQTLFARHSFPALQAGKFFLRHAEAIENEIPARELHQILLLSLKWLSGSLSQSDPVYPLHLLREIESRVWLLAVESEVQSMDDTDAFLPTSMKNLAAGNSSSIIEHTASVITKMDNHINSIRSKVNDKNGMRESNQVYSQHLLASDPNAPSVAGSSSRTKRRTKGPIQLRRSLMDNGDKSIEVDEHSSPSNDINTNELLKPLVEENVKIEASFSGWEERVRQADVERAVLSLLEFGQITAAKQLQQKLSLSSVPPELTIVDAVLRLASIPASANRGKVPLSSLDPVVCSVITLYGIQTGDFIDLLQVMESLSTKCTQGCGYGMCKRIMAVFNAASVLGLSFLEAFEKKPLEILQLLSLKAQDSLEEARLLVQTHTMLPSSIARILAESFLKGLLAAHRGGYMDCQKDEGPAPLLWRLSDFLKWAELCPSEQEIGHALMRLMITSQEIPHACEVELLILSYHFYKSSACLDGVDVLVALAANRVESYVIEGDFSCLARLVTGVSNFHSLNFILGILIENGQVELLLQKYSATETATNTAETIRGFRMAVLSALNHFNPHDLDAFAKVYNHFDMKHETASLLESRSKQSLQLWFSRHDKDHHNEDLLDSMCYLVEAAEVYATIDAGQKAHHASARASLLSLQIRIPDIPWMDLSATNARRIFVDQSRFLEALIVAEAYDLNRPTEWALVLWNQMLRPDLIEQFVAEFVTILPLQPSMLHELAKFYRSEVAARGDQSHFSVWLSPGGLPAEWVKHLGRSFRSLLSRTKDLHVRLQLATVATGFDDVINICNIALDKVPETAGPLVLRKGHGGAYLPLM